MTLGFLTLITSGQCHPVVGFQLAVTIRTVHVRRNPLWLRYPFPSLVFARRLSGGNFFRLAPQLDRNVQCAFAVQLRSFRLSTTECLPRWPLSLGVQSASCLSAATQGDMLATGLIAGSLSNEFHQANRVPNKKANKIKGQKIKSNGKPCIFCLHLHENSCTGSIRTKKGSNYGYDKAEGKQPGFSAEMSARNIRLCNYSGHLVILVYIMHVIRR